MNLTCPRSRYTCERGCWLCRVPSCAFSSCVDLEILAGVNQHTCSAEWARIARPKTKCGRCANCVRVGGKKRKYLQLTQQVAALGFEHWLYCGTANIYVHCCSSAPEATDNSQPGHFGAVFAWRDTSGKPPCRTAGCRIMMPSRIGDEQ